MSSFRLSTGDYLNIRHDFVQCRDVEDGGMLCEHHVRVGEDRFYLNDEPISREEFDRLVFDEKTRLLLTS